MTMTEAILIAGVPRSPWGTWRRHAAAGDWTRTQENVACDPRRLFIGDSSRWRPVVRTAKSCRPVGNVLPAPPARTSFVVEQVMLAGKL